ncbi:hypothetical protein RCL1_001836 [Eukaryota sp. TZLM3-RCL]
MLLPTICLTIFLVILFISVRKLILGSSAFIKQELQNEYDSLSELTPSQQKEKLELLIKDNTVPPFNPMEPTSILSQTGVVRAIPALIGFLVSNLYGPTNIAFVLPFHISTKLSKLLVSGHPYAWALPNGAVTVRTVFIAVSLVSFEIFNRILRYKTPREVKSQYVSKFNLKMKQLNRPE